ncbi:MAG: aminopeptidase P family N-terminal domain-containing protein, partial [Planctomycetes bacterium]|nr:aminopeptidase P family N-terminal domain-containing protein [Planctomycetota bacterium]
MSPDRYASRREKLLKRLRKEDVDTLLVSGETNVTYLTGFTGDSSWLLIGRTKTILISDTRYATQIAEECPGLEAVIRTNVQPLEQMVAAVTQDGPTAIAIESDSLTVAQWHKLREQAPQLELVPKSGLVEELRQIKDAGEIAEIRRAVRLAERGFDVLKAALIGGASELEVAHELEQTVRRFGGRGMAFPPIVAVGPRAALPHARPGAGPISAADFVLI